MTWWTWLRKRLDPNKAIRLNLIWILELIWDLGLGFWDLMFVAFSCHLFPLLCHLHDDMMTQQMVSGLALSDAELVSQTLSGNRDAFGQIVSRYQSLVCSL